MGGVGDPEVVELQLLLTKRRRVWTESATQITEAAILAIALLFFCLHFIHLRADFPNHSPWMDWAKYTDEGWYGDAAIRHFQLGSWYVPGDFNPAAALPVWPFLEALVFRFTGVGLAPARALTVVVFGLTLLSSYLLLRRWTSRRSLAAAGAVLLLTVSPFCYAFTRMAILEPLLVLLTSLALLAASHTEENGTLRGRFQLPVLAVGLLLPVMVLTKTTAAFLVPAILWMMWARVRYRVRSMLRVSGLACGVAAAVWLLYFGVVVRPRFLIDYRYLFSANAYTGMTAENAASVLRDTLKDGMWIGPIIFPMALVLAVASLLRWRSLLSRRPLAMSLLLWAGGYAAFLAYHDNLQPRYYLVVAVPLTLLIPVVLDGIWNETDGIFGRGPVLALAGVLVAVAIADAGQTLGYVRSPEYTFVEAAEGVRKIVQSDSTHKPLVLSISGSDLSLMTGLPSICDDFGTMELQDRVAAYRPGWYVSWNQVDDDKMDALAPMYHLQRVAAFPAMDDPERNLLILYRLDPPIEPPRPKRRRKPTPKLLVSRMGQQPSVVQLVH